MQPSKRNQHVLSVETLNDLIREHFPQVVDFAVVDSMDQGELVMRLLMPNDTRHLRPGGTISGPTIFTLADLAFWLLTMSLVGSETGCVTTQLNLSFMRRPKPGRLVARARMLKLGRRLAVGDVTIEGRDDEGPVAHAQVTYAIPPRQG